MNTYKNKSNFPFLHGIFGVWQNEEMDPTSGHGPIYFLQTYGVASCTSVFCPCTSISKAKRHFCLIFFFDPSSTPPLSLLPHCWHLLPCTHHICGVKLNTESGKGLDLIDDQGTSGVAKRSWPPSMEKKGPQSESWKRGFPVTFAFWKRGFGVARRIWKGKNVSQKENSHFGT